MTDTPSISFSERLRRHVERGPIPARRPATVLTQMLFGVSALALLCYDGWCLGWMSMNVATNAVVTAGLVVAALYGMCVERYYRGLQMPRVSGCFKVCAVVVWLVFGGVAATCLRYGGLVASTMALLTLLYLLFAFLGLLISRERKREVWLLLASTICGLVGWFLLETVMVSCAQRYLVIELGIKTSDAILGLLPHWLKSLYLFFVRHFALWCLVLEGLLLILADWWLRLKVYALRSGESMRSFFTWSSWLSIICLPVAVVFSQITLRIVEERAREAEADYVREHGALEVKSEISEELRAFHEEEERFWQEFGEVQKNVFLKGKSIVPFFNVAETAEHPWVPNVTGEQDIADLREVVGPYRAILEERLPLLQVHRPTEASVNHLVYPVMRWRLETALQLGEPEVAWQCYVFLCQLIVKQLHASKQKDFIDAVGEVNLLCRCTERLLEMQEISERQVERLVLQLSGLARALEHCGGEVLKSILIGAKVTSDIVAWEEFEKLPVAAPFGKFCWLLPQGKMLLDAEFITLARMFQGAEDILFLPEARGTDGPYIRYVNDLLRGKSSYRSLVRLALSRVNQELLLCAVLRYRVDHDGQLPPTLAALIPDYLESLPEDPVAPGTPFRVFQGVTQETVWDYQAQKLVDKEFPAIIVQSSVDGLVDARVLLPETK